jgi:hypothetical protein
LQKFYSGLTRPVLVGIEATGSMQWFLELMEELSIECRIGDPARSGRPNHASRKAIEGMHSLC